MLPSGYEKKNRLKFTKTTIFLSHEDFSGTTARKMKFALKIFLVTMDKNSAKNFTHKILS